MKWLWVWWMAGGLAWAAGPSFVEKPVEKLSSRELSDWGQWALAIAPEKWKHGETEHFIVHFVRRGESVANRCEDFYATIREFFGNRPDRMQGRKSHVFAFYSAEDWKAFAAKIGQPWAAGVARGDEFFYLASEEGRFDSKGRVQGHEMTHLVFNRFYRERLPLWLNEGIAEFFGLRKTSTATQFRQYMAQANEFGLARLFAATGYPEQRSQIQDFYAEAAIVVDFLTRTKERQALLPKFVDALVGGQSLEAALKLYGYATLAEFEKDYRQYRKRF